MFQKKQTSDLNEIKFQENFNHDNDTFQVNAMFQGIITAYANYKISFDGNIDFFWLETIEIYQGRGIASKLLDYLCTKAIQESNSLIVNVVNEDTLNSFYWKWFSNRLNPEQEYDNDEIKDHFNNSVADEESMYFSTNHPTLVLSPNIINCRPSNLYQLQKIGK